MARYEAQCSGPAGGRTIGRAEAKQFGMVEVPLGKVPASAGKVLEGVFDHEPQCKAPEYQACTCGATNGDNSSGKATDTAVGLGELEPLEVKTMDFSGTWKTAGGEVAAVDERIDGFWKGLVGESKMTHYWDDAGTHYMPDGTQLSQYDLVERIRPGSGYKKLF